MNENHIRYTFLFQNNYYLCIIKLHVLHIVTKQFKYPRQVSIEVGRYTNFSGAFYIMIGIYKITNPKNKIYIGQSVNIEKRWKRYKQLCHSDLNGQHLLYRSFIKYGIQAHKFEVVHVCDKEMLNMLEKYYVDLYQSFNTKNGLNLKDGGGRPTFSDIARKKMSNSKKGRIVTAKTKALMSLAQKGKKHSEETKIKMSLAHKNISNETRLKMSNSQKNRESQSKETRLKKSYAKRKIILNTQTGIYYFGILEAAKSANISLSNLSKKIAGINKNNTDFIYV